VAETVERMPEGGAGSQSGQKYDWEQWLDGQVWKLVETVTLPAIMSEDGSELVVPEQVIEGDFSVEVEKLRSYARNAGKRRSVKRTVRTKTQTEVVEVVRVPGEEPVRVKRKVLFVQGTDVSPTGGQAGRPTAAQARAALAADEDGEQLTLPVDDASVMAAQAELDALAADAPVRQSDIVEPEPSEDGEPEWAEVPVESDPDDPFAPAVTEPWPATDPADEVDPVTEVAAGTGEVFTERPVAGDEILSGGDV